MKIQQYKIPEIRVVYVNRVPAHSRPSISRAEEAYDILLQIWDDNRIDLVEEFKIVLLNSANKMLGVSNISSGGLTGTVADPRIIFVTALKANACKIILAHNHPSGNLEPSRTDIEITKKLYAAGDFLDIKVLDHLILTRTGFYSFADNGLI